MDKSFLVIFNGEPFTHSLGTEISVVVTNWMGMLLTSTGGRPGVLHNKLQSINNPLKKTWHEGHTFNPVPAQLQIVKFNPEFF